MIPWHRPCRALGASRLQLQFYLQLASLVVANPRLVVAELGTLRARALLNTSLSGVVSEAARLLLVLRG